MTNIDKICPFCNQPFSLGNISIDFKDESAKYYCTPCHAKCAYINNILIYYSLFLTPEQESKYKINQIKVFPILNTFIIYDQDQHYVATLPTANVTPTNLEKKLQAFLPFI